MSAPQPTPTVEVVHPDGEPHGPLVINTSDFDPAVHVRWSDRDPASGRFESTSDESDASAPKSKRGSKS